MTEFWEEYPQLSRDISEKEYNYCAQAMYSIYEGSHPTNSERYYCQEREVFVYNTEITSELAWPNALSFSSAVVKTVFRLMLEKKVLGYLPLGVLGEEPFYLSEELFKKVRDDRQITGLQKSDHLYLNLKAEEEDNGQPLHHATPQHLRKYLSESQERKQIDNQDQEPRGAEGKMSQNLVIRHFDESININGRPFRISPNFYLQKELGGPDRGQLGTLLGLHSTAGLVNRSKKVLLFQRREPPWINGVFAPKLPRRQYLVVKALLDAYPGGMKHSEVMGIDQGEGQPMRALQNLTKKDIWKEVVKTPGGQNMGGYRIE